MLRAAPAFDAFGSSLAKFLSFIPGLDIATLVLTPTSTASGDLSAQQLANERAANARVHVDGGVHFHIMHKDEDAAVKQWEAWLKSVGANPQTMKSRGTTHPRLPNPIAVPLRASWQT